MAGHIWSTLVATLRHDRLAQAAATGFLLSCLFYSLPGIDLTTRVMATRHAIPLVFLALTLGALLISLRTLEHGEERRFWLDLAAAYGCWLASRLLHLLWPASTARWVAEDILYSLFYLAMVMALERRVHRRGDWRPTRLERALSWPGVAVFILGILLYFVLLPSAQDRAVYSTGEPSLHFYLSMDIYLTLTGVYLARVGRSPRWRVLYTMMSVAFATTLLSDLCELLGIFRGWNFGSPFDGLWSLPLLAMILAARARHGYTAPQSTQLAEPVAPEGNLSGPSGRTLVMALAFPLIHFAGYGSGVLEAASQNQRQTLTLWWMLLLATIAIAQHRILNRKVRATLRDRERFEASLRSSEQDLRFMVERQHTDEQLRLSELKFFKAFRASPDIMGISTLEDGRIIEVNDAFEQVMGYRREDAVGHSASDLGLWADPTTAEDLATQLQREGGVADLEIRFKRRTGEPGRALFSAEVITIEGESCILSVAQDTTERAALEEQLAQETLYLENLKTALIVTTLEHRIEHWNAAAEDLYGWSESEVIGRPLFEVLGLADQPPLRQATATVLAQGRWKGPWETRRRDDRALHVEVWWSRIGDPRRPPMAPLELRAEGRRPRDQLILASRPTAAATPP